MQAAADATKSGMVRERGQITMLYTYILYTQLASYVLINWRLLIVQVSVVGLDIATVEKICIEAAAKVIDTFDLIYSAYTVCKYV